MCTHMQFLLIQVDFMMALEKNVITKKLLCDREKVDGQTYKAYKSLKRAAQTFLWKKRDTRKDNDTPKSNYIEVDIIIT